MTEEELKIIEEVSNSIAYKYTFGYYDIDDIKQEIVLLCLEAIDKYDPSKGTKLKTFLWTNAKNRLFNLKRNKCERPKPCLTCPLYNLNVNSQCDKFDDKQDCVEYYRWYAINSTKKNIMSPIGIHIVKDYQENNMKVDFEADTAFDCNEVVDLIDNNISIANRSLWLKLKNDIKLKKAEKAKVLEEIASILEEAGYNG